MGPRLELTVPRDSYEVCMVARVPTVDGRLLCELTRVLQRFLVACGDPGRAGRNHGDRVGVRARGTSGDEYVAGDRDWSPDRLQRHRPRVPLFACSPGLARIHTSVLFFQREMSCLASGMAIARDRPVSRERKQLVKGAGRSVSARRERLASPAAAFTMKGDRSERRADDGPQRGRRRFSGRFPDRSWIGSCCSGASWRNAGLL